MLLSFFLFVLEGEGGGGTVLVKFEPTWAQGSHVRLNCFFKEELKEMYGYSWENYPRPYLKAKLIGNIQVTK